MRSKLAFILVAVVAGTAQAQSCNRISASYTKCQFTPPTDGTYIFKVTAVSVDGKNGPWMDVSLTIEGRQCAREELSWQDNTASLTDVCSAKLKGGVVYNMEGRTQNKHATANGVTVTSTQ